METMLEVKSSIQHDSLGFLIAAEGTMFATVNLEQALMDDSMASQIVDRNVEKLLLKFGTGNKVVHVSLLDR